MKRLLEDIEKVCQTCFGVPAKMVTEKFMEKNWKDREDFVIALSAGLNKLNDDLDLSHDWVVEIFSDSYANLTVHDPSFHIGVMADGWLFARFVQGQINPWKSKKLSLDGIISKDKRHLKFIEWYKAVKGWKHDLSLGEKRKYDSLLNEWETVGYWFGDLYLEACERQSFEQFFNQHKNK